MARLELPILIAGFSSELPGVKAGLSAISSVQVLNLTESSDAAAESAALAAQVVMAIYVFGPDTSSSSRLLGEFGWIHYQLKAAEEYLLGLDGVNPKEHAEWFGGGFLRDVSAVSLDQLVRRIRELESQR